MNILMILHIVPYPPHGGSLQRTFNLLKSLSTENTLHVIALNQKAILKTDEDVAKSVEALKEFCSSVKAFEIPSDYSRLKFYSLLFLNLFSFTPFATWRFRSRKMAREIEGLVEREKIDLVHYDTIDLVQYSGFAKKIPEALNHHNVESSLLLRRSAGSKNPFAKLYLYLQGLKLKRYERKVMGRFGVNLVVSENDRINFRERIDNARLEVIPNGVDIGYFKPCDGINEKKLIYIGGMTWYPNKDAMIYFCNEIFPLIKREIPEIEIDIVGRSPAQEIKRIAERDRSIKLHGYVDDVRPYMARAAVYVVPIRVGGGTRLKILDAFACGKALVSTSIGCEGIDVTPEKDILIGDTPGKFAEQVIRAFRDDDLRKRLEKNARILAEEKYSWQIIGGRLNEIYKELVNE